MILNKPKLSIITVSYNCVNEIEETILSVINQDYPNLEYIIIDGGSTDGTVNLIKKYESKLSYWVSEPDKGLYDAMNKGIMKATGDWVTMRNCGDMFAEKDSLSKLFAEPVSADIDFVCAAAYRITDLGYYIARSRNMESKDSGMRIVHPATFVRTSWHQQRLFDIQYSVCADYNLVYTSVMEGHKIEIRNIPIVIFPAGGYSSVHWDCGYRQGRIIRGNTSAFARLVTEFNIIIMKVMSLIRHILRAIPYIENKRNKILSERFDIKPMPLPVVKFY